MRASSLPPRAAMACATFARTAGSRYRTARRRPPKSCESPRSSNVAAFYFRAVASDGKVRTGTLNAETEKWVAQELRRQGLTPVYVGTEQKKGIEFKLPAFGGGK